MIQLDSRKKIIISATILFLVVLIGAWLFFKNHQNKNVVIKPIIKATTSVLAKPEPRVMTKDEKTNVVGIDPSQEAEVLNDQNGLYVYRIKK